MQPGSNRAAIFVMKAAENGSRCDGAEPLTDECDEDRLGQVGM
jgi:hypothetical protein